MKRGLFGSRNLLLLLTLVLIALEVSVLHVLQPLDNKLSDYFVRMQAQGLQADQDIVIVDIDERSLANMNDVAGSWPWPRSVHGELVQAIAKQQPKAIVFDIMFSEADKFRPQSDAFFNEVLGQTDAVYLPLLRLDEADDANGVLLSDIAAGTQERTLGNARASLLLPRAVDEKNWRIGLINFLKDDDGVGRRYHLYMSAQGARIPSLPVRVATDLGYPIPLQDHMVLSWRGPVLAHPHISYADLYADIERKVKLRSATELRDKIVVLGSTASGLHDVRATPVDTLHPGVEMLATALDNLKNQSYMRSTPRWASAALSALLVLALFFAYRWLHDILKVGALLLPVVVLLPALEYGLVGQRVLLPVASTLLFAVLFYFGAALIEYFRERRDKEYAVQMFSRFVNPHVVKELVTHGGLSRGGERRQVTLLFSDIRGFTTLAETQTPEQVVQLLNDYFSLQVGVIFKHGGALDKFIGDAIMAFWGAPLDDALHAQHAVAAALEMCEALQAFKDKLGAQGENFDVGIGLHSGPAVVGLIGSEQRREYTAIGDTVNLASRIEGLTKGVARVLVSEDTMRLCAQEFEFIDHGVYPVKGRNQGVRLYEPRSKSR